MKRAWWVAWLVWVVASPSARADVACPSPKTVELALWLDGIDGVEVGVLEVDRSTVRVRAVRGDDVLVDRAIPRSPDCEAMADAISLMVAVALDEQAPPTQAPVASPPPVTRAADVATPATSGDGEIGLESAVSRSTARYTVAAAAIAGAGFAAGAPLAGGFGELDVAVVTRRDRGLRLGLSRDATGHLTDQLARTAWTARVEWVGYARSNDLWLRGGAGAALVTSSVRDTYAMSTTLRSHPAASASVVAGLRIGARVSLRADLAALGFPVADRYRIGGQEVARSPRAVVTLGLGAQIDTDW